MMKSHPRRYLRVTLWMMMLCTAIAAQATSLMTDSIASRRGASDTMPHLPQADSRLAGSDSLYILPAHQARVVALSDSLHRSARVELGIPPTDTTLTASPDSTPTQHTNTPSRRELRKQKLTSFSPSPDKATWSAIVFPGGGQIYNHKYWKLPIVYGGFLGCAYALNWNNQMYSDYSQAYLDIMDDDPGTASYEDFLPPRYNVEANREYLERVFKNRKDNYRRQRDMSIFCFIGVYLISIVDAYVDAELSNFDITEDLSVEVKPSIIDHQRYTSPRNTQSYGLQCSFSF